MLFGNQNLNAEETSAESLLPYTQLRGFVESLLKRRLSRVTDVEDISQNVFRRSWQWVKKNDKRLSPGEWKMILAKIAFNEINRFYSKKVDLLAEDLMLEETEPQVPATSINPQFILEIAEALIELPTRQRLAVVLHDGEILPYLKLVLPDRQIAMLLEISEENLSVLESEIPMSDLRIKEIIELLTQKACKSSIRDERCKGRKLLRRRLFGNGKTF